jgi:hypothetical protein
MVADDGKSEARFRRERAEDPRQHPVAPRHVLSRLADLKLPLSAVSRRHAEFDRPRSERDPTGKVMGTRWVSKRIGSAARVSAVDNMAHATRGVCAVNHYIS